MSLRRGAGVALNRPKKNVGANVDDDSLLGREYTTLEIASFALLVFLVVMGFVTLILVSVDVSEDLEGNERNEKHCPKNHGLFLPTEGSTGFPDGCCLTPSCASDHSNGDCCSVDIIIVGCGSSGSTIAHFLSDAAFLDYPSGKAFTVLCLEKGRDWQNDTYVQYALLGGFPVLFAPAASRKYSVNMFGEQVPTVPGFAPMIQYAEGKGGTGNHDYLLIVKPSRKLADDHWAAVGGPNWNYDAVTAITRDYENYLGSGSPCSRGTGHSPGLSAYPALQQTDPDSFGTQFVRYVKQASPLDVGSAVDTDYTNCDYETSIGNTFDVFYTPTSDPSTFMRSSPGIAYLGGDTLDANDFGLDGRPLRVITGALVDKINFNEFKRAVSVSATVNGKAKTFYAKKRIIVSSNAILTPGILERSGVGDPALLANLGIPVVHPNPAVGENFQQHFGTVYAIGIENFALQTTGVYIIDAIAALTILPEFAGLRSMQLFFGTANFLTPLLPKCLNFAPPPPEYSIYYVVLTNVAPLSRGSVHVWDKSPYHFPNVTSNINGDPAGTDRKLLLETIKIIHTALQWIAGNNTLSNFISLYPPASAFSEGDASIQSYIDDLTFDQAHWSSTASMGTVLDGNLSLLGVEGVTVADTSSLPNINNGNTRTQALITAFEAINYLKGSLTPPP